MSWSPPESTPQQLWLERSVLDGTFLWNVLYGVECCVFAATVYVLLQRASNHGSRNAMLAYVSVLFAITTVGTGAGMKWAELVWIDDRGFPGGPAAYILEEFSNPMNILSFACYIVGNFMTDLLILYRCWVIWNHNVYVMTVPGLAVLASFALSIVTIVQTALPGSNLWVLTAYNFAIPYWSISMAVNITLTAVIVVRLVLVRKELVNVLGAEYAQQYTSLIAIVVESAFLYSITSIMYLIAFVLNSNVQNLVLPFQTAMLSISPQLIVIRVAFGKAFSHETAGQVSDVRFRPRTHTNVANIHTVGDSVTLDEIPAGRPSHNVQFQGYSGNESGTESRTGSNMELKLAEEEC